VRAYINNTYKTHNTSAMNNNLEERPNLSFEASILDFIKNGVPNKIVKLANITHQKLGPGTAVTVLTEDF
jgi:hypothetical protein